MSVVMVRRIDSAMVRLLNVLTRKILEQRANGSNGSNVKDNIIFLLR